MPLVRTHYVVEADFELILLFLLPECLRLGACTTMLVYVVLENARQTTIN